jgi:hypothetical protein
MPAPTSQLSTANRCGEERSPSRIALFARLPDQAIVVSHARGRPSSAGRGSVRAVHPGGTAVWQRGVWTANRWQGTLDMGQERMCRIVQMHEDDGLLNVRLMFLVVVLMVCYPAVPDNRSCPSWT